MVTNNPSFNLSTPLHPGLVHFGYVVRDIDSAVVRFETEGYEVQIAPTTDPVQGVHVAQLTDGVTPVELVSPLGPDAPVASRLKRGGGLDHLCYAVEDVASALANEELRGGIIVCQPVYAVAFERTVGFAFRKSGLIVEYMSLEANDG